MKTKAKSGLVPSRELKSGTRRAGKAAPELITPDPTARFEAMLVKSPRSKYSLRLYVTGATPRSARAIANVRQLCEEHLKGRYELTIVDLYQTPGQAKNDEIICAPTLVKKLPPPVRRLIGDLSDPNRVLVALDIKTETK